MSENIKNLENYNAKMRNGLLDKIFFIDKIDSTKITTILDYGCADGSLVQLCNFLYPNYEYIGFDTNEDMIRAAVNKNNSSNIKFFCVRENVDAYLLLRGISKTKVCVVFSSVLHEIFSNPNGDDGICGWLCDSNFGAIAIRDMCVSAEISARKTLDSDIANVYSHLLSWQVKDFIRRWGSLSIYKNLLHLLLKYPYIENWNRELNENYFACSLQELLYLFRNMSCVYMEHYTPPFIARKILRETGITISAPTHIKLLMEREEK